MICFKGFPGSDLDILKLLLKKGGNPNIRLYSQTIPIEIDRIVAGITLLLTLFFLVD